MLIAPSRCTHPPVSGNVNRTVFLLRTPSHECNKLYDSLQRFLVAAFFLLLQSLVEITDSAIPNSATSYLHFRDSYQAGCHST